MIRQSGLEFEMLYDHPWLPPTSLRMVVPSGWLFLKKVPFQALYAMIESAFCDAMESSHDVGIYRPIPCFEIG
jgi:hypothetical protein